MWIRRLRIAGVRCLRRVEVEASPGLNVLVGPNGAGKTSVLEAISVLAGGKSFRSGRIDPVVSRELGGFEIFADVDGPRGAQRLGVSRQRGVWALRANGQDVERLGRLTELLAAVFFEPDSHELLAGGSEGRRRFLDWGVFHVEPGFGAVWPRYQRALQQRNALLKLTQLDGTQLDVWDQELAEAGEPIAAGRTRFVAQYRPILEAWCEQLAPELGRPVFSLQRGWSEAPLVEELAVARDRDRVLGHSTRGPHRADWNLRFAQVGGRDELSRGQLKLACFALSRAMLDCYRMHHQEPPVACLDDLFSELDASHQRRCLETLSDTDVQVWVTGTEVATASLTWAGSKRLFHVERGQVQIAAP